MNKITSDNASQYIGRKIQFRTTRPSPGDGNSGLKLKTATWKTATLLSVVDSGKSIRIDYPSLNNCLDLRRVIYLADNDDEVIAEQFNYNWRPPAFN
jgi:hypothetical protein